MCAGFFTSIFPTALGFLKMHMYGVAQTAYLGTFCGRTILTNVLTRRHQVRLVTKQPGCHSSGKLAASQKTR